MTSLFLVLEILFQLLFRLMVIEKKEEKHPVVLERLTGYHGQLFMGCYTLAVLIQTFLPVSPESLFTVCFNDTF